MKKLLVILLILVMALTVASCKDDNDPSVDTGDTTPVSGSDSDQPSDSDEVIDAKDYSAGLDDNGHLTGIRALDFVVLPDYDPIVIPESAVSVPEEKIEEYIQSILTGYVEKVNVTDRAVKDGDTVNIDYVGSVDGVEFEGGNTQGAGTDVTIGETSYIAGFLDQLIGHMPGDEFDINVTFPDPYENNPDLAGKPAVFRCTVNYIVEEVVPEFNDEFVAAHSSQLNDCTTAEELRDHIADNYRDANISEYIQNYLVEKSEFTELPDAAYQFQVNSMLTYYKSVAQSYGMTLAEISGMTEEELIEKTKESNIEQAKLVLAIQAIAEDCDKIVINDELLRAYFLEQVGDEDYSGYVEEYGSGYVMLVVMNDTVIDYLINNAVIDEGESADA